MLISTPSHNCTKRANKNAHNVVKQQTGNIIFLGRVKLLSSHSNCTKTGAGVSKISENKTTTGCGKLNKTVFPPLATAFLHSLHFSHFLFCTLFTSWLPGSCLFAFNAKQGSMLRIICLFKRPIGRFSFSSFTFTLLVLLAVYQQGSLEGGEARSGRVFPEDNSQSFGELIDVIVVIIVVIVGVAA